MKTVKRLDVIVTDEHGVKWQIGASFDGDITTPAMLDQGWRVLKLAVEDFLRGN